MDLVELECDKLTGTDGNPIPIRMIVRDLQMSASLGVVFSYGVALDQLVAAGKPVKMYTDFMRAALDGALACGHPRFVNKNKTDQFPFNVDWDSVDPDFLPLVRTILLVIEQARSASLSRTTLNNYGIAELNRQIDLLVAKLD